MSVEAQTETRAFEAEVSQVLNLMIRSLYSNKEVFLRELISNGSDACEKLRFEALSDDSLYEGDSGLSIRVEYDKDARTVTITDNGIGMDREEVTRTIGTIANSGTRKFIESMTGNETQDAQLIGQFGVGFYASFIVADKVTFMTRKAGLPKEQGVRWQSTGEGSYDLETIEREARGSTVVLHLREDESEFLEGYRLRSIINKFSDHITIPIEMKVESHGDDEEDNKADEFEQVNQGTALWLKSKSDISDEEYTDFYKYVSHDFEEPLLHVHNRVEGTNEYTSLLYIPKRAPFDLWDRDRKHGIKLFVRRVFIMDEADKLMPHYLRFVKGVVDSDDLPLNVSREILQHNRKIETIKNANVKRILGVLEKLAKNDPEKYQEFWDEFGRVMKEGPGEDFANKEKVASLLRFATTKSDDKQVVSLDDYIGRMPEGQNRIYYITADSLLAAKNSPHLEVFKKKDIEVLLLVDRVDEWLVSHLMDYSEKPLQSVAKGELDLGDLDDTAAEEAKAEEETHGPLIERIKGTLEGDVKDVRVSHRLTESPACLVVDDHEMSANLSRVLKSIGQDAPETKPIIEINTGHPLIKRLEAESNDEAFAEIAKMVFEQAQLAEGGQLTDPAGFVHRLNKLLFN